MAMTNEKESDYKSMASSANDLRMMAKRLDSICEKQTVSKDDLEDLKLSIDTLASLIEVVKRVRSRAISMVYPTSQTEAAVTG